MKSYGIFICNQGLAGSNPAAGTNETIVKIAFRLNQAAEGAPRRRRDPIRSARIGNMEL
jgi:hypothetical protein